MSASLRKKTDGCCIEFDGQSEMSTGKADGTPTTSSGAPAARPAKPYEPEGQFILRLPEPAALLVKMALDNTTKNVLKDRLKIDMQAESRNAKVYVDSMEFSAKLVDLPCVVESLKTVDKKTFNKTGDICQVKGSISCKHGYIEQRICIVMG